jgi:hypothetical protein
MKSKQTMFFAVKEDLDQIFKKVEIGNNIHYYLMGLLDTNFPPHYDSIFQVPNLGVTSSGDWNRIDSYLVMKTAASLTIRDVPQKAGGIKFAVDQLANKESIEFKPGGIYKEGVIVAGRVATVSEDQISDELYKLFVSKIKKEFKKIGVFYVGKIAEEKLKFGWRLVTNERLSTEHDLSLQ